MRFSACRALAGVFVLPLVATPADAHVGVNDTSSFLTGFLHPLSGIDHILAMVTVGIWAALQGGRAVWIWPASFVLVMLLGGALGFAGVAIPLIEPRILASLVAIGLLVALAISLPVVPGAVVVAFFALFHGNAHGAEAPAETSAILYAAGFAAATAALHGLGIATAAVSQAPAWRLAVRSAGGAAACAGLLLIVMAL